MLEELTDQLEQEINLSSDQMSAAMAAMMSDQTADEQIALFLLALSRKGETADEVAAAARVIRHHMTPIRTEHPIIWILVEPVGMAWPRLTSAPLRRWSRPRPVSRSPSMEIVV